MIQDGKAGNYCVVDERENNRDTGSKTLYPFIHVMLVYDLKNPSYLAVMLHWD